MGDRQRSNSRTRHSESSDRKEYHQISNNAASTIPSAEILIAIPENKGSKKYKTYLGLVDSGSSGSLVNKGIVEFANFKMQLQKNSVKWDTATGSFHTDGVVTIENYHLPQFTRKRHITSSFHMFQKWPKDKYDFILG